LVLKKDAKNGREWRFTIYDAISIGAYNSGAKESKKEKSG